MLNASNTVTKLQKIRGACLTTVFSNVLNKVSALMSQRDERGKGNLIRNVFKTNAVFPVNQSVRIPCIFKLLVATRKLLL